MNDATKTNHRLLENRPPPRLRFHKYNSLSTTTTQPVNLRGGHQSMSRKTKMIVKHSPLADAVANDVTVPKSVQEDDGDVQMNSADDDIPKLLDKSSDADCTKRYDVKTNHAKKPQQTTSVTSKNQAPIPFMDTFFQLSSEESQNDRSVAARDLIHHCLLDELGVNHEDAAYALTRLMNGLCTGRAASRQGFASCLSSFLRVVYSPSLNNGDKSSGACLEIILREDSFSKQFVEDSTKVDASCNPAVIVRHKLLSTTQFSAAEAITTSNDKGRKKKNYGGKMKDSEKRDHSFGRLFGILAVVRSGILVLNDFPSEAVKGYAQDLIDLYNYKSWMKEPAAHALIELLSSLDTESNQNLIAQVVNDVIAPTFFLSNKTVDMSNEYRAQWLRQLTPEQVAVALHLQTPRKCTIKYDHPLDKSLVSAESVPALTAAFVSTSCAVYPRCHIVWNTLWMYLTEESKIKGQRQLRMNEEFSSVVKEIVQHVVIDVLLGNAEASTTSTHERRSLALQIVCALSGSSDLRISLPPSLIESVLCPKVITGVFLNVLCASGGIGKKNSKEGGGAEHYLKPLTSQALGDLIDQCCEEDGVDRRFAFAKAFLGADHRFDTRTKTNTVSSLLMLESSVVNMNEETKSKRQLLWQQYLSFLEDEIVSATSLHNATVHVELMFRVAKLDLTKAPADEARRILRFFMSGAFFDCSCMESSSTTKKGSSKKKKKDNLSETLAILPTELSSGLRIKEILQANGLRTISQPIRSIMSARFYSMVADLISFINSNNHGSRQGSRPESIYRAMSEICDVSSLLEASGAKKFPPRSTKLDSDDTSDAEDSMEISKKCMLRVQAIANGALVEECNDSGNKDILRAKAVFATSCASLMMSLYLQLNNCGALDANEEDQEEDEDEEIFESLHEYISDLADCVDGFNEVFGGNYNTTKDNDRENPLATMAALLVNILSSPTGGEDSRKSGASKLTRETVKVAWSGMLSAVTGLNANNKSLNSLVDEDVMVILIQSVCGEKAMGNEGKDGDDESIAESNSSEEEMGESAVFVDAAVAGVNLDEVKDDDSDGSEKSDEGSQNSSDECEDDDADIELDPAKLENLLLEDSDAEMSDNGVSGILEHHAGADKALAQLIKLKQEARKEYHIERDRTDLCNRLRCATLLDMLFTPLVFKSGWLPVEAVLGSTVPILRSYKAIAKNIQASSSANAKKSLGEKNALLERLSDLVKNRISKFRLLDGSGADVVALKASSDIFHEMNRSMNSSHCSCCSVALTTALRCISNANESAEVRNIYSKAIEDWSSRKATKIHSCVFDDLINRMPSLASDVLIEPLMKAASGAHSPFLKCESIKLLSAIYKQSNNEEGMTEQSRGNLKKTCSKAAETLRSAYGDLNLQRSKHRDEVLIATKCFVNFLKAQNEGILSELELASLQETLTKVAVTIKSGGMKQLCSQVSHTIASLPRRIEDEEQKPKRPKEPKSSKKQKKSKK